MLRINKTIAARTERESFPLQDSNFPMQGQSSLDQAENQKQPKKQNPTNIQKAAKTVKGLQKFTKCSLCVADGEPYVWARGKLYDFPQYM